MLVDVARSVGAVAVLGDSVGAGIGDPARDGGWRGFAPLLAEALGAALTNLAVSGSRVGGVREVQLPAFLRRALGARISALNDILDAVAARHRIAVVDLAHVPGIYSPAAWAIDRVS